VIHQRQGTKTFKIDPNHKEKTKRLAQNNFPKRKAQRRNQETISKKNNPSEKTLLKEKGIKNRYSKQKY
jgi:hypothetical protein